MSNIHIYCHTCNHWEWDENIYLPATDEHPEGGVVYPGHCILQSARCINAVADGDPLPPLHFQPMEEVHEE